MKDVRQGYSEGEQPQDYDDSEEEKQRYTGYTLMSGVQTVMGVAIIMATLLTLWNPRKLMSTPSLSELNYPESDQDGLAEEITTAESRQNTVGLLAGHWGDSPGEVCADGIIEADVNIDIANRTAQLLRDMGYTVDVFPEFDVAMLNYQSSVFVAIYAGSCAENPPPPSGFKVGTSLKSQNPEAVNALALCLAENYQQRINIPFSYEVVDPDNPAYHIFRDIHNETPAALIEVGSLKADRRILTSQADRVSEAIAAGIICFLNQTNEANQ